MLIDLLLFLPLAILTNTAFPFPFDYVLIFFAENHEPHQVWVFAALGSVCAAVAGFVDIKLLTAVGEWTGRGRRWQVWNLDRLWFYAAVFLCAFLPVPYLLVRLVLVRGSPHPVVYAATVGSARLPRYVITVYFWQQLNLPPWASAALIAAALPFGVWQWYGGGGRRQAQSARVDRAGDPGHRLTLRARPGGGRHLLHRSNPDAPHAGDESRRDKSVG